MAMSKVARALRKQRAGNASFSRSMGDSIGEGAGVMNRVQSVGHYGYSNFRSGVGGDWGNVAKWAAGRAGRGAVVGGAVGGTAEAAQGGSFWSGAKEGAFNGAVGWTAYRGAGQAFAGGSKNPMKVAGGFGNAFGMTSADKGVRYAAAKGSSTGQKAQMSKSVQAIMQNKQDGAKVLR